MADLETIISAGIDIGTTTTQLVFSRLTFNNTRGYGVTPKIEIVQKLSLIHIYAANKRD